MEKLGRVITTSGFIASPGSSSLILPRHVLRKTYPQQQSCRTRLSSRQGIGRTARTTGVPSTVTSPFFSAAANALSATALDTAFNKAFFSLNSFRLLKITFFIELCQNQLVCPLDVLLFAGSVQSRFHCGRTPHHPACRYST